MSGVRWGRGREVWSPVEAFLLLGRAGAEPLPVRARAGGTRRHGVRAVPSPSDGAPSTIQAGDRRRSPARRFVVLGPEDPVPSTVRAGAAAAVFARAATDRARRVVVPFRLFPLPHQEVRS
ncbi:hypothetical protein [Umezawaea tangerina]|uniref:Uncharacterized protein n=1 Tax=Umezawaea tangerina TaxID=84725 RepID=A0A2T0SMC3_9PSEU|nr:hypothetical protein [Umezawaea tangerina]PRY34536.1 hypothetical protein CLV43_11643 [Umezawaea tangerina]